jgi:N6-L-threonylcarbamoyladenine synthase
MNLLAIETSCDETAAAVIAETGDAARPWALKSSVVASQDAIHREWGGVVPELASRQHLRDICGVVDCALEQASVGWADLGAVAVTQGPGLVGSLLVGVSFAKSIAWSRGIPLVPVHHLAGHIESLVLAHGELPLPSLVLVVSGGHTSLYFIREAGRYELLGRTRDDAAGEAYDKVAKLLGLGYPGGPILDRLARQGNDRAYAFRVPRMTHADRNQPGDTAPPGLLPPDLARHVDFSFSGLKTARDGRREKRQPAPLARRTSHRAKSPTSRPAFSASSWSRSSTAPSRRPSGWAPGAWGSRAASPRTAGCARTRTRAARRPGCRCSCRRCRCRPTTPR